MRSLVRRVLVVFALFVVCVPSVTPSVSAQAEKLVGYAVRDVTYDVDCSITVREHGSIENPESEVLSEWVEGCPAGSVIETTSVGSEAEAAELGAIFVPSSGDPSADVWVLDELRNSLAPAPEIPAESEGALACSFLSKSKTMSIYVNAESQYAYSRAYYWRDTDCSSGISSGAAYLGSNNSKIKWVKMTSSPPIFSDSHGCATLSTSLTSDYYGANATIPGASYKDEVRSTAYPCSTGIGTSYTNTMVLS